MGGCFLVFFLLEEDFRYGKFCSSSDGGIGVVTEELGELCQAIDDFGITGEIVVG